MCCSSASGVSTAVPALYAGKFIAAFDRQHPRDLLDIRSPLAIDDWLRAAFIVYLLSDNRPMTEVLAVRFNHIAPEFVADFQGHAAAVTVEQLVAARTASSRTCRRIIAASWSGSTSPVRRTGACWRCRTPIGRLPSKGVSRTSPS